MISVSIASTVPAGTEEVEHEDDQYRQTCAPPRTLTLGQVASKLVVEEEGALSAAWSLSREA